ncbi:MAG TPA: DUF4405 domain-containing protein [Spirochaetota bacterium]|nr:DUF4405 domain-containing protein [Spirochaetota bacterium]
MPKRGFSFRAFISLFMFLDFIFIALTGIILYIAPPGRIAYWINWKLAGIDKTGLQTVHTVFALLFIIATVFHVYYNWAVFWNYIISKARSVLNRKAEMLVSITITLIVLIGSIAAIPPFSTIMEWGDILKDSWHSEAEEPPIPHAELMNVQEIADKTGVPLETAITRLRTAGIKIKRTGQRIAGIAKKNNISARKVFMIITGKEQ